MLLESTIHKHSQHLKFLPNRRLSLWSRKNEWDIRAVYCDYDISSVLRTKL
jgi:hypothetical protein